ncbi:MAG: hypothetical protein ACOX1W_02805 [Catenisphaera adipataccumulans]|jgi:hypothetical protein|uniref:hypothetical protein n=1 Tax=Catenisphaera adipataccumulans TaxID=700500 RepID=UPI003D8B11A5
MCRKIVVWIVFLFCLSACSPPEPVIDQTVSYYDPDLHVVYYGFRIRDPRPLRNVQVKLTFDQQTQTVTIPRVDQTMYYASAVEMSKPKTMKVRLLHYACGKKRSIDPLQISAVHIDKGTYSTTLSGLVKNRSQKTVTPMITAVYRRHGKPVAMKAGFADRLNAKQESHFDFPVQSDSLLPTYDSVHLYVYPMN